jgi:hypothetical protein
MLRAGLGYAFVACALVAIVSVTGAPVGSSCLGAAADGVYEGRITTRVLIADRGNGAISAKVGGGVVEMLERRSFFGSIGNAISHATHAVTHAVSSVAHTVAHAVTHPIEAVKHIVHTIHHAVKHVAHAIHHAVKHVAHAIHHAVKHIVKGVKDAVHFVKQYGPTIAKIGLKVMAAEEGMMASASKFVPGIGPQMSKALRVESQGLDMASGMIHAHVPKGWQTAMDVMDVAQDPAKNGHKHGAIGGVVGAAAGMILG